MVTKHVSYRGFFLGVDIKLDVFGGHRFLVGFHMFFAFIGEVAVDYFFIALIDMSFAETIIMGLVHCAISARDI